MTKDEISRALDHAYNHADQAFERVRGAAFHTRAAELEAIAETLRKARDLIGAFDLDAATSTVTA